MDIKFIKKTKDEWEIVATGEETIFNPLKAELLKDETVTFTGFKKKHPLLDDIRFVIKGSNVESSFKKAIKALKTELQELGKLF